MKIGDLEISVKAEFKPQIEVGGDFDGNWMSEPGWVLEGNKLINRSIDSELHLSDEEAYRISRLMLPVVALKEWCEIHGRCGPIAKETARDWANAGKIPAYKSGRDFLISPLAPRPDLLKEDHEE